ncbi:hypothetical protein EDD22DRAFT_465795 [Suillus occidentalis]|nr:hypothetical protein EDD22DRAFT_465795 [Suillus occidentalis]
MTKRRVYGISKSTSQLDHLQHRDKVECATFSANGRVLVTGCNDKNAYACSNAILKQAGFEDLLSTDTIIVSANIHRPQWQCTTDIAAARSIARSSLDPSVITADYTRRPLNIYDIYYCTNCSNRAATTPSIADSSSFPLPCLPPHAVLLARILCSLNTDIHFLCKRRSRLDLDTGTCTNETFQISYPQQAAYHEGSLPFCSSSI